MSEKSPAHTLESVLSGFRGDLTVADASARSGLALRDAEEGLRVLSASYAGHLSATSKGELVYSFPRGLVKPAETRLLRRAGRALVKTVSGVLRFVVRAWVSVVLVGYAVVFLAVLIALALRGGDDRDSPWDGAGVLLRVIAEALFWTFHPFSPVALRREPHWMHVTPHHHGRLPFYERVNRFVFGPTQVAADPREQERAVLAEIRRQKGRVVPGDVMRVTGLEREEAERLLLRLVVDYHGDIQVSDGGVISYTFAELRTTAAPQARGAIPTPAWERSVQLPPLTGNSPGSNLLFAAINGFNLLGSGYVLANDLTLERLTALITRVAIHDPNLAGMPLPAVDGIPLVLGAIPFAFSVALFALPLFRLVRRPAQARRVARENGWRGLLRQVLAQERGTAVEYDREELARAWQAASNRRPTEAELEEAVRALGGTVELRDDGKLIYRFEVISQELEEVLAQRAAAPDAEATAGDVIFSSADEGSGIRDEEGGHDGNEVSRPGQRRLEGVTTPRLEGKRETLDFIERVLSEAEARRRR